MKDQIEPGTIVALKPARSPEMVVMSTETLNDGRIYVTCEWFDAQWKLHSASFARACIRIVTE